MLYCHLRSTEACANGAIRHTVLTQPLRYLIFYSHTNFGVDLTRGRDLRIVTVGHRDLYSCMLAWRRTDQTWSKP